MTCCEAQKDQKLLFYVQAFEVEVINEQVYYRVSPNLDAIHVTRVLYNYMRKVEHVL